MKKSTFEQIGGTYHQESGYFLPDLFPPESVPIDIWGQRRKYYLKTKREPIYTASLLSGKLESHLSEVDAQAETMFFQLVKPYIQRYGAVCYCPARYFSISAFIFSLARMTECLIDCGLQCSISPI